MPAACELGADTLLNAVADRDIRLTVGRDAVLRITFRNRSNGGLVNWTGWTFAAEAAATKGAVTPWATATVTHGGTNGVVTVRFDRAETALLTPGAEGFWDLRGTDPDTLQHQVLEGAVEVVGAVT